MKSASISHLKTSLSSYLKLIKSGEEIIITDRGRPIAKIVLIKSEERDVPAHLKELEQRGSIKLGTGVILDRFWDIPRLSDKRNLARRALKKDREESR